MGTTESIFEKIKANKVLPINKVALAFSGGLDSILCLKLLKEIYHAKEIIPINVDVGQGYIEIETAKKNSKILGHNLIQIDAKDEFINNWISKSIKANGLYGDYPLGTAMTRHLIGKIVAQFAIEQNCDSIAEGTTGKSNDQFRMKNTFEFFTPNLRTVQPVREFNLNRNEEIVLAKHYNLNYYEAMFGGDDKTIWCRSIASGAITDINQIPEDIWIWYKPIQNAKNEITEIKLEFLDGIPISLNDKQLPLEEIINSLNLIGGENGIGFIDSWEQDIIDIKSREFYEAPAALIIIFAHKNLERVCFPKKELEFKELIDKQWAEMVFCGDWFHPLRHDLDGFIDNSQKVISGTIELLLYKGNIRLKACNSAYSLYHPEFRTIQAESFDQRICGPAAELRALPYKLLGLRNKSFN